MKHVIIANTIWVKRFDPNKCHKVELRRRRNGDRTSFDDKWDVAPSGIKYALLYLIKRLGPIFVLDIDVATMAFLNFAVPQFDCAGKTLPTSGHNMSNLFKTV